MPDATLAASYQAYKMSRPGARRPDKALAPHPAPCSDARCDTGVSYQAYEMSSSWSDKAFTPHPAINNAHR
ncbi:hypothetical protein EIG74_04220 [Escherichia coli O10]|nr:hypothetical protein [Escherichia coli O10]